ncbi:penicillin-binding protein [Candidatus Roizmanbacteria bacterium]|nr:penicillin-binding protein [Candidatus Roizmanbacteria bacterium]
MKPGQDSISGLIFKGLYHLANFFVLIGEMTQWPFKLLIRILVKLFRLRPRVSLPKISFDFISLRIRFFLLGALTTTIIFLTYQSYLFVKALPSPDNIGKINYPLSTHIYDRNGILLYEIYRDQNRTQVSLKSLPKYVIQATIAIEDKDFYRHNGVAFVGGILRAFKESLLSKNIQGGSTITQQLVKSALLTPERTVERKVKEIILALWTERLYSKDQILEMYLNQVPYGGSSYGVEEAAKTYFGKPSKELTLDQAALLAGLPQAPSVYSPYSNPEAALKRRNDVLEAMAKQGFIDEKLKAESQNSELTVLPPKTSIIAPHFVFYTKSQLESYYGIEKVEEGGLKVTTTLDSEIQKQAETILSEELEKISYLNVTNGAILVTRPSTGEILAMVGSADYFYQPWGAFNVTTALRQPGSSIKPIMYSLALQNGYTAASIIDDSPVIFKSPGADSYQPVNYDGKFHGKVPLRYALANSYNIPAVKVLNTVGVDKFIDYGQKLGIDTWQDRSRFGLSLTLGGGEVTMVDMAEAFGTLANLGYKLPLSYSLKIQDNTGQTIKELRPFKIREMDSGVSYIMSDILSDNQARTWAFGPGSTLEIPGYKVAVKTGTTNDKRDNWTIGYTPEFLVAVWVGNNDNSPMNPYLSSGITGASPIWNRVMSYLLKNYGDGNHWYEKPDNIVEKTCFFGRKEYFIKGTENKVNCGKEVLATPTPKQ